MRVKWSPISFFFKKSCGLFFFPDSPHNYFYIPTKILELPEICIKYID